MARFNAKNIAILGVLTALSIIMFMVENLFPPFFVPGARLGLGNIFILLALIWFGFYSALLIVIAKCLIVSSFFGFSALMYSLPSGIFSLLVSFILIKFTSKFSIVAISAFAAVCHNLVQNLIFAYISHTQRVLMYAPYLTVLGLIAGTLTGIVVFYVARKKHFVTNETQ